ncbi:MAG: hypothetical protein JXA98_00910 [Methanosarcinaceae archaeon]|nr:hypothetical protein [Methanosarcinaceae archaeon]
MPLSASGSVTLHFNAAFIVGEIQSMLHQTNLKKATVTKIFMGLEITGEKIQ